MASLKVVPFLTYSLTNLIFRMSRHRDKKTLNQPTVLTLLAFYIALPSHLSIPSPSPLEWNPINPQFETFQIARILKQSCFPRFNSTCIMHNVKRHFANLSVECLNATSPQNQWKSADIRQKFGDPADSRCPAWKEKLAMLLILFTVFRKITQRLRNASDLLGF